MKKKQIFTTVILFLFAVLIIIFCLGRLIHGPGVHEAIKSPFDKAETIGNDIVVFRNVVFKTNSFTFSNPSFEEFDVMLQLPENKFDIGIINNGIKIIADEKTENTSITVIPNLRYKLWGNWGRICSSRIIIYVPEDDLKIWKKWLREIHIKYARCFEKKINPTQPQRVVPKLQLDDL